MDYTLKRMVESAVEAQLDKIGKAGKCLNCGDERQMVPIQISVHLDEDGGLHASTTGTQEYHYTGNDWVKLLDAEGDQAKAAAYVCWPCAVKMGLRTEPVVATEAAPAVPGS